MESLAGRLLVATPMLFDDNFRRTVLLVAEHSEEGAMGIVLNRPSESRALDVVPELEGILDDDDVMWQGGPVQPEAVVVLAEFSERDAAGLIVYDDIGFVGTEFDHVELAASTERARAFSGYAGWTGGQLEAEIESGSWLVETPLADDALAPQGTDLWAAVVRRKGPKYRLLATMPYDPSLN